MSRQTDEFAEIGIRDPHTYATRGNPYIVFSPGTTAGSDWELPRWRVVLPGYQTDPDAHPVDHGCKTFLIYAASGKSAALRQAEEWASRRYGITQWARTPYRDVYMDPEYVRARNAELHELGIAHAEEMMV